jgi:glucose-6-phosphate-specific signal transduction histidine kinase
MVCKILNRNVTGDTDMKDNPIFKGKPILVVIALSVLALGYIDYATGYEFGFFVFYFLPIAIAAWKLGFTGSYLISILSAIIWFLADLHSTHLYSSIALGFWNTIIRLVSFLIIAYSTSKIRLLLVKERETAQALRKALSQVKTLSGLIPICASCKKIRDDQGYWNQLETFIQEHSEAEFSHGICPECMKKLYGVVLDDDPDLKKP